MTLFNRREMFEIAASAAAYSVSSSALAVANRSPNEKVGVAELGCGRGANLASWFAKLTESQVVAICDPDESRGMQSIFRRFRQRAEPLPLSFCQNWRNCKMGDRLLSLQVRKNWSSKV